MREVALPPPGPSPGEDGLPCQVSDTGWITGFRNTGGGCPRGGGGEPPRVFHQYAAKKMSRPLDISGNPWRAAGAEPQQSPRERLTIRQR